MNKAIINCIKYQMRFTGDDGREVVFDYVDFEVAPNLFTRFKLTPNNQRALQRFNPNLYQLFTNIPYGVVIPFQELELNSPIDEEKKKTLSGIYSTAENEL